MTGMTGAQVFNGVDDELFADGVKRMVFLPFNEHSARAVHNYLESDIDFAKFKGRPDEVFPINGETKTLKKLKMRVNGTVFVSIFPGEDIPDWVINHAGRYEGIDIEAINTTDFWLNKLYSSDWDVVRERARPFYRMRYCDPRELIGHLLEKREYSFRNNGYEIHWEVLDDSFPERIAKFVVLGPNESSLDEYRKKGRLYIVNEKRLSSLGDVAAGLTFPGQTIITPEELPNGVTRSVEECARFLLDQSLFTVATDLYQSGGSARESGLKIYADFGIQPLIRTTVKRYK